MKTFFSTCYYDDICSDFWNDKIMKNKKLDVRLNEYEYHQLAQEAERRGMSKSDLIAIAQR